jgi:hypothetical protein
MTFVVARPLVAAVAASIIEGLISASNVMHNTHMQDCHNRVVALPQASLTFSLSAIANLVAWNVPTPWNAKGVTPVYAVMTTILSRFVSSLNAKSLVDNTLVFDKVTDPWIRKVIQCEAKAKTREYVYYAVIALAANGAVRLI